MENTGESGDYKLSIKYMKPSKRIIEKIKLYKELPENNFDSLGNVTKAILDYLDEEWKANQTALRKLKEDLQK